MSVGAPEQATSVLLIIDRTAPASTVAEALESFRPDCVVLDLGLTDDLGRDGFGRVTAAGPDVPIVLLTTLEDENVALQALALGARPT